MRANRAFLGRVTRFLAADAGVRQFLDIGPGLPAGDNTPEGAHRAAAACRTKRPRRRGSNGQPASVAAP